MAITFSPTSEQNSLIQAVRLGLPIIKVDAGAGTGKSSSAELLISSLPQSAKKIYIVYNKSASEEAKERFRGYSNLRITTSSALAYSFVIGRSKNKEVKGYRVQDLEVLLDISNKDAWGVYKAMKSYCQSTKETFPDGKYGVYASKLWDMMETEQITKSYEFLDKRFNLGLRRGEYGELSYALLIKDEFQDTTLLELDTLHHINAKSKVYIGDDDQSIYGFNGANNTMNIPIKDEKCYPLTTSFRYNQTIADKANTILSIYKGVNKNLKGRGTTTKAKTYALLSRTNAELVWGAKTLYDKQEVFQTVRDPKLIFSLIISLKQLYAVRVKDYNGKIDYKAIALAKKETRRECLFINREFDRFIEDIKNNRSDDFFVWLKHYSKDVEVKSALKVANSPMTLPYIRELESAAISYFELGSTLECKYILSTAHSSKGSEWDFVKLASDFKDYPYLIAKHLFDTYGDMDFNEETPLSLFREDIQSDQVKSELIEEFNLLYVALTRARALVRYPDEIEELMSESKTNKNIQRVFSDLVKKHNSQNYKPSMGKSKGVTCENNSHTYAQAR